MIQFLLSLFLIINSGHAAEIIETDNAGEQAMLTSLKAFIDRDDILKNKNIIIGAGKSGYEGLTKEEHSQKNRVYLTWQYLTGMEILPPGTIVVILIHAMDEKVTALEPKLDFIKIDGVMHTVTPETIKNENTKVIDPETNLIVMLGGDTQQMDGSWKLYTTEMALNLVRLIPDDKKVLILNGPRTGKHTLNGRVNEHAHKGETDHVTQAVLEVAEDHPLWTVADFKYGTPSLWKPALKFCSDHPKVDLILPGESTSMISEALALGICPSVSVHDAMTSISQRYVDLLTEEKKATIFPSGISPEDIKRQDPIAPQEIEVVKALRKLLK